MDTPGLFNKRQFAPDLILSQVTNDALKPSRPWFEKHMNTVETLIAGLLPQLFQDLISRVTTIAENIDIRLTLRYPGDFGHRIQSTGENGTFNIVVPWITRGPRVIRVGAQLIQRQNHRCFPQRHHVTRRAGLTARLHDGSSQINGMISFN